MGVSQRRGFGSNVVTRTFLDSLRISPLWSFPILTNVHWLFYRQFSGHGINLSSDFSFAILIQVSSPSAILSRHAAEML